MWPTFFLAADLNVPFEDFYEGGFNRVYNFMYKLYHEDFDGVSQLQKLINFQFNPLKPGYTKTDIFGIPLKIWNGLFKKLKKNNFFSNIIANSTEMHYQYGLKTQENISPILTLRALSENSRTVVYSQTCYLLNPYFWARNRTVYKSYLQCTIITWTWSKTHSSRSFEKTLNFWLADGKSKFRGYHWLPRFRTHIATGYHWLR